jgi:hypothetical protein
MDIYIQKLLTNAVSKKVWVMVMSTYLLYTGYLDQQYWMAIAIAYIGAQSAIDHATSPRPNTRPTFQIPNTDQVA